MQTRSKQEQGWIYRNSHPFNESNNRYIKISNFASNENPTGRCNGWKSDESWSANGGRLLSRFEAPVLPVIQDGCEIQLNEPALMIQILSNEWTVGTRKSSKNKPPSVVAQWTSLRNPSFLKREWVRERKEGKIGKVQRRRRQQQQQKRVERERKVRE